MKSKASRGIPRKVGGLCQKLCQNRVRLVRFWALPGYTQANDFNSLAACFVDLGSGESDLVGVQVSLLAPNDFKYLGCARRSRGCDGIGTVSKNCVKTRNRQSAPGGPAAVRPCRRACYPFCMAHFLSWFGWRPAPEKKIPETLERMDGLLTSIQRDLKALGRRYGRAAS